MVRAHLLFVVLATACNCGGNDGTPIDAPPADVPPDIDNGTCGADLRFTGEYVDWDTDAQFCGIFDARFQVQGGGASDTTAPNGRFDLCIPNGPEQVLLDITPPSAASQCTTPSSTYTLPGIAVATRSVILAGGFWSGRNFTADRQASLGVTLDPTKGHVFVHVEGTPRAVSLSSTHDAAQAMTDTTWAPGNTGHEVFFPNVPAGTTMVTVAGGTIGASTVPVVAGTITNVSLLDN